MGHPAGPGPPLGVAVHAIFSQRVMAQQPRPDRPLVLATVALPYTAVIIGAVIRNGPALKNED